MAGAIAPVAMCIDIRVPSRSGEAAGGEELAEDPRQLDLGIRAPGIVIASARTRSDGADELGTPTGIGDGQLVAPSLDLACPRRRRRARAPIVVGAREWIPPSPGKWPSVAADARQLDLRHRPDDILSAVVDRRRSELRPCGRSNGKRDYECQEGEATCSMACTDVHDGQLPIGRQQTDDNSAGNKRTYACCNGGARSTSCACERQARHGDLGCADEGRDTHLRDQLSRNARAMASVSGLTK